jgi:hypothetical protein
MSENGDITPGHCDPPIEVESKPPANPASARLGPAFARLQSDHVNGQDCCLK